MPIELLQEAFITLDAGRLWPGFDPQKFPVAVWDGEMTWLISHPAPPEGFVAVRHCPGLFRFPGLHPSVRANTVMELNGVLTATLLLDRSRTLRENLGTLVHELFHAFQREHHPEWQANEVELLTYPEDDAEILALRWLELLALKKAISQRHRDRALAWGRLFLRTRETRFSLLNPDQVTYEREIELVEGTANYVEDLVAARNPKPAEALEALRPGGVRATFCESGCGIASLLDRVCQGWKEILERGGLTYLDELLAAEADGISSARFGPSTLRKARTWAERKRAELVETRKRLLREYVGRPGWSLEIQVLDPLWPTGFDPMNLVRLDERKVLHRRWLRLTGKVGDVECLARPCLTEAFGDHPLFQGVRRLLFTGLGREPSLKRKGSRVEIVAEGVHLRLEGMEITSSYRRICIHPSECRGEEPGEKGA